MNETISVIIPVYNVESYLDRCLSSVCASRYTDLEIICVDDGSTDGCSLILDTWAEKDSRIRVIHTENHGLSAARNAGMDMASGRYIAFIDPDDYVTNRYFELLLKELRDHDAGIAVCGYQITAGIDDPSREVPAYTVSVFSKEQMLSEHRTKTYCWGKLFRRELLETVRFRRDMTIEDAPFNADVVRKNGDFRVTYLNAQMYFYFCRNGSLSRKLDANAYLQLSEYFRDCSGTEENPVLRAAFLTECVKRGVTAEFMFWMDCNQKQYRKVRRMMLPVVMQCRRKIFGIFVCFPATYWLYRYLRDPSIRGWKRKKRG